MRKLFFILMMLTVQFCTAQVSLQPSIPVVGLLQKDQLWNILVVNSTNQEYNCRLELVLQDRMTSQEVLTASTGFFRVAPGANPININSLNPVQYNYISTNFNSRVQNLIPAGNYIACYNLTVRDGTSLANECTSFDSEPLSPPMLAFPADSSELNLSPAQFSWMPPTPDGMFSRLHYEILITEISSNQKPGEAVEQNIPLYSNGNLFSNLLNYPSSAIAFEKNKWYAWQVIARDDRNYAGKSETWTFKITQENKTESSTESQSYVLIKNNKEITEGIHHITGDTLRFKYYSFDKERDQTIQFLNTENEVVQEVRQKIIYGDNFFNFKASDVFKKERVYTILITDSKEDKHTALFSIQ